MTDDLRTALGEHAFFAGMDSHHLDTLASLATWSEHRAHSWIARAGEYPDSFHAVVSGRAGIEINAIAIEDVGRAVPITEFYRRLVITPNGFVLTARGLADYPRAIREKLIRETAKPLG